MPKNVAGVTGIRGKMEAAATQMRRNTEKCC